MIARILKPQVLSALALPVARLTGQEPARLVIVVSNRQHAPLIVVLRNAARGKIVSLES